MFSRNKNRIYIIAAIIIVAGVCVFFLFFRSTAIPNSPVAADDQMNFKTIQIGGAMIKAELAVTQAEQIQGLSGRTSLATSTGMFFVFDYSSNWGIWMKDMKFPIDVLWISDALKVSDIVENMQPSSYPYDYLPHTPARYVLEVPVGTVKKNGIAVGQDVAVK
jgi:uncharacterized membrane protein (UPF0127 family)